MKLISLLTIMLFLTGCAALEKKPETCPITPKPEVNGIQYPKKASGSYKPVCYGAYIDGKCTGPEF